MRERVNELGGTFELRSDDSGTMLKAEIPVPQAVASINDAPCSAAAPGISAD
jgi:signal transduction histidine kinase